MVIHPCAGEMGCAEQPVSLAPDIILSRSMVLCVTVDKGARRFWIVGMDRD